MIRHEDLHEGQDQRGAIIPFIPRPEIDAIENLGRFISLCRDQLTGFGKDLEWDAPRWDVSRFVQLRGKRIVSIVWSNHDTSAKATGKTMLQPFLDFARAYVRYQYGLKQNKDFSKMLSALRSLERGLIGRYDTPRIEKADPEVFNRAAQLLKEKYAEETAYIANNQLKTIAAFLVDNRLTTTVFHWQNNFTCPTSHYCNIGKAADTRRTEKMPTETSLDRLARIFCHATEPFDVFISSTAALLVSAPERINEVFVIPSKKGILEVKKKDLNGNIVGYGLRWKGSKGARDDVKWVVKTMSDVAKKAIKQLRELTEEARKIAEWYEKNPDKIYLPEEIEHFRGREHLNSEEIMQLFGLTDRSKTSQFIKTRGLRTIKNGGRLHCRFEDIERHVLSLFPKDFPILDKKTGLKYKQALFVVPYNFFRTKGMGYRCMFDKVTLQQINTGLGARNHEGGKCIFSRFGFTEPDGSPIKITTHQFRHYLNTLAYKGGLSQLDIAKWSGRENINQNKAYNHTTATEMLEKIRRSNNCNHITVPNMPVTRESFEEIKPPIAHTTESGFCLHDFTMLPCQSHLDHITCTEHAYIKGDKARNERVRKCLVDAEKQNTLAENAINEKEALADRWMEHNRIVLSLLRQLVSLLDDPKLPEGTIIMLSNKNRFSPIGIAIEERRKHLAGTEVLLNRVENLMKADRHITSQVLTAD